MILTKSLRYIKINIRILRKTVRGKHLNKKIAPIVVAICLAGYYIIGVIILLKLNFPNIIKIIALIVSIIIAMVIVMVLIERIKEINRGEEDDLGKY
jgi:CHASE2 domain-containing sensor protein